MEGASPDGARLANSTSLVRVVIADDHPGIREVLRHVLARQEGVNVMGTAASGAEALDWVERCHPDVLVLDLSLPDADGLDLLKTLRAKYPGTRIVACSMYSSDEKAEAALAAGACAYVEKSGPIEGLVSAVRGGAWPGSAVDGRRSV